MKYIGLDVHKKTCAACILNARGDIELEIMDIPSSFQGMDSLLRAAGDESMVLLEAGTVSHNILHHLEDLGALVFMGHATDLKAISRSMNKNDRIDAQNLARCMYLHQRGDIEVKMSYVLGVDRMRTKSLIRYREYLSLSRASTMRQIRSNILMKDYIIPAGFDNLGSIKAAVRLQTGYDTVVNAMARMLEFQTRQINHLDRVIKEMAQESPYARILMTIPFVGPTTAMAIAVTVDEIGRFETDKALCAYVGIAPWTKESAGKKKKGHIMKTGDKQIRRLLYYAVTRIVSRIDCDLADFYQRMRGRGQCHKMAVVSTARKLLSVMWHMLKRGESYRRRAAAV